MIYVIGIGPGCRDLMTKEAIAEMEDASISLKGKPGNILRHLSLFFFFLLLSLFFSHFANNLTR